MRAFCTLFLLALAATAGAQEAAPWKVNGLELPADQVVAPDEGFVTLEAKCKGEVRWLVISSAKVKFFEIPQSKSVVIAVPPNGAVAVFAVGLVDGRLTEFARTNVTVNQAPQPPPAPGGTTGPLHVTFFVDLTATTPELALVLNSQKLRQAVAAHDSFLRVYDIKSPVVKQKKLEGVVASVGGSAVMLVQRADGTLLEARRIPATDVAVLSLLEQHWK